MVSNPHFYGQSTTLTPNQIEDGVDFPHTGIIKALADGLGQNYAISGFDITIDSATQIDVGAGVIFRDGKRESISAVNNLTLGRTTASENSYHLVVVDKDKAIAIRSPSAKDKVADYTVRTLTSGSSTAHIQGDTIIAVVTHNGSNPMPIQYLTVDKAENSLSIGYSNNGTYTEVSSITGTSAGLFISNIGTATVDGSDKVLIQDAGSSDVIKTVTASSIAALGISDIVDDTSPQLGGDLDVNGNKITGTIVLDGNTSVDSGHTLTIDSDLELSVSSNDAVIKNTNQDNDIIFKVNDGGSDTESMRIDGDINQVKIKSLGVGSAAELTITESSDDITFKNTVQDKDIIFNINDGGSDTEVMRIDGSQSNVAVGATFAEYKLDVNGSIRRKGNVQAITEATGNAIGPPPVVLYNILSTDDVILASAPTGTPPNNLTLHLPDASGTDIGRTYRIIAIDATNALTLDRTGSTDAIHGPDDAVLSLPISLSTGKIYDVICVADNKWMLLTLN
jgi:hypothetical protein|tara:strand:+ start:290 stop:1813 length:1524 start_codon:yes stop_codon:yes gene_type:complete